jgi:hypothetical protein
MSGGSSNLLSSPELSTTAIATIGAVGGTLLIASFGLLTVLIYIWTKHRRLIRDLESHGIEISQHDLPEIRRSRTVLTRAKFGLANSQWNQLYSAENITLPADSRVSGTTDNTDRWGRQPGVLNNARKALANRPLALRSLKVATLSSVLDGSPGAAFLSNSPSPPPIGRNDNIYSHACSNSDHLCVLPVVESSDSPTKSGIIFSSHVGADSQEELRPRPLFSEASRNQSQSEPRVRKKRAQTVGGTSRPSDDVFGIVKETQPGASRPTMHARSFSFGGHPPTSVPEGPVPPLPLAPKPSNRSKKWLHTPIIQRPVSRQSVSSLESISSSLLIGSPKVGRSSSVRLKHGASRDWQNSIVVGPRLLRKTKSMHDRAQSWSCQKSLRSMKSVHNYEGQHSQRSSLGRSSRSQSNRNSAFESLQQCSQIQDINSQAPANRNSNTLVTPGGSPKRLSGIYQPCSQLLPSPLPSPKSTGVSSTRSSNGNPFQWDPSPMQTGKPSAMKGSPTARKGHRRQQCVRIAIPPNINRARSPASSMADILEEGSEATSIPTIHDNSHRRSLPRPPSTSIFNPDIKVLRGSLTSSSPALSLVAYANEFLENEHRNSTLENRNSTRLSNLSDFEIPKFPSPAKRRIDPTTTSPFSFERQIDAMEFANDVPEEFKLLAQPLWSTQDLTESGETSHACASSKTLDGQCLKVFGEDLQPGEMILNFEGCRNPMILECGRNQQSISQNESPPPGSDTPPCSPKSQPISITDLLTKTSSPSTAIAKSSIQPYQEKEEHIGGKDAKTHAPSPVRKSISLLRRMNSEARADFNIPGLHAARRFLFLDQESSPSSRGFNSNGANKNVPFGSAISLMNGISREDSIMEIQNEVDGMLAEVDITDSSVWGITDVENLLDLQDFEDIAAADDDERALIADREDSDTIGRQEEKIIQQLQMPSAKKAKHSPVSVWEDGETYWIQETAQQRQTLKISHGSAGAENLNPTTVDGTTPIKVNVVPPSVEATPMSMYDASGFLKGY